MTLTLHTSPRYPDYELVSVEHLPDMLKRDIPPLEKRKDIPVGAVVRIHARIVGGRAVYPNVLVVECTPTGYVGEVTGQHGADEDWLPVDSRVVFLADHVCEWEEQA